MFLIFYVLLYETFFGGLHSNRSFILRTRDQWQQLANRFMIFSRRHKESHFPPTATIRQSYRRDGFVLREASCTYVVKSQLAYKSSSQKLLPVRLASYKLVSSFFFSVYKKKKASFITRFLFFDRTLQAVLRLPMMIGVRKKIT